MRAPPFFLNESSEGVERRLDNKRSIEYIFKNMQHEGCPEDKMYPSIFTFRSLLHHHSSL